MKFDMGRAWNDALALISANRQVVLIVAAVFFFLPYLALMLLMPSEMSQLQADAGATPAEVWARMSEFYGRIWWALLLLAVVQGIGMLGLLALLTDRSRPTVGEALVIGAKSFLPYIAAQLLISFGIALAVLILVGIGAATGSGVVIALMVLVAVVLAAYLFTKFSLAVPVIAIERVMNPITALTRSWRLTKGNSVRLFFFFVLLVLVLIVIAIVLGIVFGLLGVALGETGAQIVGGLANALLNMVFVTLFLAVLAAVHRQLSGPSAASLGETFE